MSDDGCSAGRELVENAHVEIAVDGHCCRARDRRSCHDEHIRDEIVRALRSKHCSLLDAEAMLFIDDHHSEAREIDTILNERMGADHDVDATIGQACQNIAPILTGDSVGE